MSDATDQPSLSRLRRAFRGAASRPTHRDPARHHHPCPADPGLRRRHRVLSLAHRRPACRRSASYSASCSPSSPPRGAHPVAVLALAPSAWRRGAAAIDRLLVLSDRRLPRRCCGRRCRWRSWLPRSASRRGGRAVPSPPRGPLVGKPLRGCSLTRRLLEEMGTAFRRSCWPSSWSGLSASAHWRASWRSPSTPPVPWENCSPNSTKTLTCDRSRAVKAVWRVLARADPLRRRAKHAWPGFLSYALLRFQINVRSCDHHRLRRRRRHRPGAQAGDRFNIYEEVSAIVILILLIVVAYRSCLLSVMKAFITPPADRGDGQRDPLRKSGRHDPAGWSGCPSMPPPSRPSGRPSPRRSVSGFAWSNCCFRRFAGLSAVPGRGCSTSAAVFTLPICLKSG